MFRLIKKLTDEQKKLRLRILEISFKSNFTHLGSCLSAVDLIDVVYKQKKEDDKFILSNGHAGIALYVVLEKYKYINNQAIDSLFIHPDRNLQFDIHVSSGSLGQGLPIAVGMALADKKRTIYCMISDGECAEGSIWEALRIASEQRLNNLVIILNANGWGAYDAVNLVNLKKRLIAFGCKVVEINGHDQKIIGKALNQKSTKKPLLVFANTTVEQLPFLSGLDAHYYLMNKEDYELAVKLLQ